MPHRDWAIRNARVYTLDPGHPHADALLIRGDRIALVGSAQEVLAAAPPGAPVFDLAGRTVLPGFIDTHVHIMSTGLAGLMPPLPDCRTIADVLHIISGLATASQSTIPGFGLDPLGLAERRMPTRPELDAVAPDAIVFIVRRDGHSAVLNSKALTAANLPTGTPGIEFDENGEPTGLLSGTAWEMAIDRLEGLIEKSTWRQAVRKAAQDALAAGLTTVHCLIDDLAANGSHYAIFSELQREVAQGSAVAPHFVVYLQTTNVERVLQLGLPRIGGCLLIDGSVSSHTAALSEPYADRPDCTGTLYYRDADLHEFVRRAHCAGLQIAMHAIGDRAIEQLLGAYESALREAPRADHRHRIEHCLLPTADHLARASRLGLAVATQPAFQHLWGGPWGMYQQRLGSARRQRFAPIWSVIESGIIVGGGSDSPVTAMHPLLGIHSAVNYPNESERLTVRDAIAFYTRNAARLAFEEHDKGTIAVGKLADLTVLAEDPFDVPATRLWDIAIDLTIVGGRVLYARQEENLAALQEGAS